MTRTLALLLLARSLVACEIPNPDSAGVPREDSVAVLLAAVRGFHSPNGEAVVLNDELICYERDDAGCAERGGLFPTRPEDFRPLLAEVAGALGVELRPARPFRTGLCPWGETAAEPGAGMTLELGRLDIRVDTAEVTVVRSCYQSVNRRGFFDEGQTLLLVRGDFGWTVTEMLGGWIV